MEDDFNTAILVAVLFGLVRDGNTLLDAQKINKKDAKKILAFLKDMDKLFCFIFLGKEKNKIPASVMKLVEQREEYRKKQQWQKADEMRKEIGAKGYEVEDTSQGFSVKKKQ